MPERVLPDSTWVVHVNVEGIVGSNLGRALLGSRIGMEIRADIAEDAMAEIGIDPLRDLRGVTLFGRGDEEDEAVVLVSGTQAIDAPLARLPELVENYSEIREGTRVVHSWDDDNAGGRMHAYAAPGVADERVVLLSGNIDSLRAGIIRLEAGGAEVAPALRDCRPGPGSQVFISAQEIPADIGEGAEASMLFRFARAVTFDKGEQGQETYATARITTASPEDAAMMLQAVQGMLAIGRMVASSEPDLQPLLRIADACRGSTEGRDVTLSVRVETGALVRSLEELDAAEHREHAERADGEDAIREDLKKLERLREVKEKGGKRPE
jgi:hypothetical protein